jgi:hypothetical protein
VLLSSAMVALNSIYTAKYLPLADNDPWRLTAYKHINACALFVPVMLIRQVSPSRVLWFAFAGFTENISMRFASPFAFRDAPISSPLSLFKARIPPA